MPDKLPTTPPRGMRDLLPAECALRDAAVASILSTYRRFGFQRVETPALEGLPLLTSGQGGENEKLIFKVLKRGEKLDLATAKSEDDLADLGLRFDLTVPLARFYAEHQAELPQPWKAIQIGSVWRAERPQKGRFRQFTQCDIDVIGEAGEVAEVELILATTDALTQLGLSGFTVRLNDRRLLTAFGQACGVADAEQQERLFIALDKLDKVGAEGVVAELGASGFDVAAQSRVRDLLVREDRLPGDGLREFARSLGAEDAAAPLEAIQEAVRPLLGVRGGLVFDPTLVRGMGYYTGPIFEIAVEGQPLSIAGGGRYDRMIGKLSGREVPACGFSIGFERLMSLLTERGWQPEHVVPRLALLYDDAEPLAAVMGASCELRAQGWAVTTLARKKKAGKQLDDLEQQGYRGWAAFRAEGAPEIVHFGG